jgi:hypothetical protein
MNEQFYGAELSPEVEAALAACGRDRVFHSTAGWIAIRWEEPTRPAKAEWLTVKPETPGEGHDSCGRRAALEVAKRLREVAAALVAQAESIERPLLGGTAGTRR